MPEVFVPSTTIAVALIVTMGTIVTAGVSAFAAIKVSQTHNLVNSRMTELLEAVRLTSHAEGISEGREIQRDINGARLDGKDG